MAEPAAETSEPGDQGADRTKVVGCVLYATGALVWLAVSAWAIERLFESWAYGPWTAGVATWTSVGAIVGLVGLLLSRGRHARLGALLAVVASALPWLASNVATFSYEASFGMTSWRDLVVELARTRTHGAHASAALFVALVAALPLMSWARRPKWTWRGALLGAVAALSLTLAIVMVVYDDTAARKVVWVVGGVVLRLMFGGRASASTRAAATMMSVSSAAAGLAISAAVSGRLNDFARHMTGSDAELHSVTMAFGLSNIASLAAALTSLAAVAFVLQSRERARLGLLVAGTAVALFGLDVAAQRQFESSAAASLRPWSQLNDFQLPAIDPGDANENQSDVPPLAAMIAQDGTVHTSDGEFAFDAERVQALLVPGEEDPHHWMLHDPDGVFVAVDRRLGAAHLQALLMGAREAGVSRLHFVTSRFAVGAGAMGPLARLRAGRVQMMSLGILLDEALRDDLYAELVRIDGRAAHRRPNAPPPPDEARRSVWLEATDEPFEDVLAQLRSRHRGEGEPARAVLVGALPEPAQRPLGAVQVTASDAGMQRVIDEHRMRDHSPGIAHPGLVRCLLRVTTDAVPRGTLRVARGADADPTMASFGLVGQRTSVVANDLAAPESARAELAECVEQRVTRWRFPARWPDDATVDITFGPAAE